MPRTGIAGRRALAHLGAVAAVAVVGIAPVAGPYVLPGPVSIVLSTPDGHSRLQRQPEMTFQPWGTPSSPGIKVDPDQRYQTVDGFGAAFTDSATYLLGTRLSPAARHDALRTLFDRSQGIGLSVMRLPMGASDYTASGLYSYDDMPTGESDPQLRHFSTAHDNDYTIPVVREALRLNPDLKIVASPWSPPVWMKTNGSMLGVVGPASCGGYGPAGRSGPCDRGALKEGAYEPFAQYFVRFIKAYRAAGIPIHAVTPLNEPGVTPDYPGMIMSPQEASRFVGKHLGPTLERAHLNTKILAYDWNWQDNDPRFRQYLKWEMNSGGYVETLLADPVARRYIGGISWHGYGGDPARMSYFRAAHPDLPQYELERSSTVEGKEFNALQLGIRSTRNWAKSAVTWNLALDSATGQPGPKIGTACPTCLGTMSVAGGAATPTREYYELGHLSKFVAPGAVRIASTTSGTLAVEHVAFRSPDGTKALVATNSGTRPAVFSVQVTNRGSFSYALVPGAAVTFTWR